MHLEKSPQLREATRAYLMATRAIQSLLIKGDSYRDSTPPVGIVDGWFSRSSPILLYSLRLAFT